MKYRIDDMGAIIFAPSSNDEKSKDKLLEKIENLERRLEILEKVVQDGKLQSE